MMYIKGVFTYLFLFSVVFTSASQIELKGAWKDDQGGFYCISQNGNLISWYMDNRPYVHNVFRGMIAEKHITGRWSDLPGGQLNNTGTLALQIESGNRMKKIGESISYQGNTWIRVNDDLCVQTSGTIDVTTTRESQKPEEGELPGKVSEVKPHTGQYGTDSCPCGLGERWKFVYYTPNDWNVDMKRRPNSNVFDIFSWTSAASGNGILTLNINDREVLGRGINKEGKNPSTWQAEIGDEITCEEGFCCSVSGKWYLDSNPGKVFDFNGRIICVSERSTEVQNTGQTVKPGKNNQEAETSALPASNLPYCGAFIVKTKIPPVTQKMPSYFVTKTICDNPRTLPIMDYWLAKAKPVARVRGQNLCYEEWGRVVDISIPGYLKAIRPPDTFKNRCEWLWEDANRMNDMKDSNGVLGNLEDFVLMNIWKKE